LLMRLCPKCRALIPADKQYCDKCQPLVDKATAARKAKYKAKYDKKYNRTKRNPKYAQFYRSREWKTLRAVKLSQSNYMCDECKAKGVVSLAVDVHHVIPISRAWDKRLDIDNLKCLCVKCHNEVHNRWNKGKRHRG